MVNELEEQIKDLEKQIIELSRLQWCAKKLQFLPYAMHLENNKIVVVIHNYEELVKIKKCFKDLLNINDIENNTYVKLNFVKEKIEV